MPSKPMYSAAWFDTFAARVPEATTSAEVAAIARWAPAEEYPRLLDVGCGTGRVAARLVEQGYQVVGIDISVDALQTARRCAPGAKFIAMDQRHVGHFRWTFDVVVVLWNSLGFGSRSDDQETVQGLAGILRSGGRALLDLYHPDWLHSNEQRGAVDSRGAKVDRWLENGRSHHLIRYPDGTTDSIAFNVYRPEEIQVMLMEAGLRVDSTLVWWKEDARPSGEHARFQVVATRASHPG